MFLTRLFSVSKRRPPPAGQAPAIVANGVFSRSTPAPVVFQDRTAFAVCDPEALAGFHGCEHANQPLGETVAFDDFFDTRLFAQLAVEVQVRPLLFFGHL
jgi:hypothetical protein